MAPSLIPFLVIEFPFPYDPSLTSEEELDHNVNHKIRIDDSQGMMSLSLLHFTSIEHTGRDRR